MMRDALARFAPSLSARSSYREMGMRKSTVRGLSLAVSFSASTMAFASLQAAERTIVGAWTTSVTLLNCQSGELVGVPPFPGLATFHDGGTMSEFGVGPGSSPALRRPSH